MKSEVPITKKETKSERKLRISVTKQRVLRWHEKRIQENGGHRPRIKTQ